MLRRSVPLTAYVVITAAVLFAGTLLNPSVQSILQAAFVLGALAVSFQVVYGLLGQLSLGHAALFGTGAYGYAVFVQSMPPAAALLLAGVAGGVVGCAVALITMRVSGIYFAVVTFALTSVAASIVNGTEVLGRNEGLIGVESISTPEGIDRTLWQYLLAGTVFGLFLILFMLGRRTRFGATLEMARTDYDLAVSQGIDVRVLRIVVTLLSGVLAGVAGGLLTQGARFVSPDVFGFYYIITPLAIVAVGGLRHNLGVLPGLAIVVVIPRFLGLPPILNVFIAALLLVVAIMIFPRGVAGAAEEFVRWIRDRRKRHSREGSSPPGRGGVDEMAGVRS